MARAGEHNFASTSHSGPSLNTACEIIVHYLGGPWTKKLAYFYWHLYHKETWMSMQGEPVQQYRQGQMPEATQRRKGLLAIQTD